MLHEYDYKVPNSWVSCRSRTAVVNRTVHCNEIQPSGIEFTLLLAVYKQCRKDLPESNLYMYVSMSTVSNSMGNPCSSLVDVGERLLIAISLAVIAD